VLHLGHVTRGELHVGDDVITHVDQHRRHAVAANHTATHLLNLALRTTLGEGIDQKGSLVAPDRLRFDFSHAKPVGNDELARIEHLVEEYIRKDHRVFAESAPLFLAKGITGVRAVFGETYPDPVRVVSIGQPVQTLLENPKADWHTYSVEFCGGVHVNSTREINQFVVVSEEAVAKGIRRITALTGVPAQAALAAAQKVARRLAAARGMPIAQLAGELSDISHELDSLTLPCVRKAELRAEMAALQERVKEEQKAASAAKANEAASIARQIAQSALTAGSQVIVNTIDVGDDRKALQVAINTVSVACNKSAVMLLAPDAAGGTVAVMAVVPPILVGKGLSAGDWVREVAAVLGGKGGGRPEAAQGGGTQVGKIRDAIATATSFAQKKLGL
jgi:alanyl-tRNA synthetase